MANDSLRITLEPGSVQPREFSNFHNCFTDNKSKSYNEIWSSTRMHNQILGAHLPHPCFPLSSRMRAPQPLPHQHAGHVGAWLSARLRVAGRRRPACPGLTGLPSAVGAAPQARPPAGARAGARAPGDGPPALTGRRLRGPLEARRGEGRYGRRRAGATSEGRAAAGA